MKLQAEFMLSLPGSNAAIERLFFLANIMWSKEKNQLYVDAVKAVKIVKTRFIGIRCDQFHEIVK
jgi:hypothetical protein